MRNAVRGANVNLTATFGSINHGQEIAASKDASAKVGAGIGTAITVMTGGLDLGLGILVGTGLGAFIGKSFFGVDVKQATLENVKKQLNAMKPMLKEASEKYIKSVESLVSTKPSNFTGNTVFSTTFELKVYTDARVAAVAGSFNDWNSEKALMTKQSDGWIYKIDLARGKYQYKFVIDGKWITDAKNPLTERDDNGGVNSILTIS